MLRPVLALLLCLVALPLSAAPARVISGEHEGFTRLVVEMGAGAVWLFGQNEDGYELRSADSAQTYDLSTVFRAITRDRLAAIWTDDATGALRLRLACACHAAPFEYRPGTVVIDLKDGPPPEDSAFERPLPAVLTAKAAAPTATRTSTALSYVWADAALGLETAFDPLAKAARVETQGQDQTEAPPKAARTAVPSTPAVMVPAGQAPADAGLAPLREELMREISLGAAQGVVDMALPESRADKGATATFSGNTADQTRFGLNALPALPQLRIAGPNGEDAALGADGADCPNDVQLDLAAWGDDRPVWDQISEARSDLTGEFDLPNAESLRKAVHFHLFIGFGAETRSFLRAYPSADADAPLWTSLSYVLDAQSDPAPAFAGFGACDSSAALWAMLSDPRPKGPVWNVSAVQRSFSALPLHLRQLLGPRLVEALVSLGQDQAVPVITNAIRRAGGQDDRGVRLMEAEVAAGAGDHQAADVLLQTLIQDPGPESALATAVLIEGKAARGMPVAEKTVIEMEALAVEHESQADGPRFLRALVLARALSGDFARAFAEAPDDAALRADLWRLLAQLGNDDLVLELATLPQDSPAPSEGQAVASALAERFLALGLPAQAQVWLASASQVDPMLAARVAMARHDGRSALAYLREIEGAEAETLRVKALLMTGDEAGAATKLARAGDLPAATSARARARDWVGLRDAGSSEWQTAARMLEAPATGPERKTSEIPLPGPLAQGAELAEHALATRNAIAVLLASVPAPESMPTP